MSEDYDYLKRFSEVKGGVGKDWAGVLVKERESKVLQKACMESLLHTN